jgi:hypothetical protein
LELAARSNRTHSIPVFLSLARTGQQLIRSVLDVLTRPIEAPAVTTCKAIAKAKEGSDTAVMRYSLAMPRLPVSLSRYLFVAGFARPRRVKRNS